MKKALIVGMVLSLCFATSAFAGGRHHRRQQCSKPKVIVVRVVTHSPSHSWHGQRIHRDWNHGRQSCVTPRQHYRHRSWQPVRQHRSPMREGFRRAVRTQFRGHQGHAWSNRHGHRQGFRSQGRER